MILYYVLLIYKFSNSITLKNLCINQILKEYKKHGSFHPGFGFDHDDPFADFFEFFEMGGHPRRRQQQKEQAEAAKKKNMDSVLIDVILTQKQMKSVIIIFCVKYFL